MPIDLNSPSEQSAMQREAIAAGVRVLLGEGHNRARFTLACGVGKTFLQLKLSEALIGEWSKLGACKPRRILVLVPTLALVRQSRDEWLAEHALGNRYDSLCVCSDPSLKHGVLQAHGHDEIQMSSEELAELGIDAAHTTAEGDIERINRWLDAREGQSAGQGAVSVIFSTYQSAAVVGMALKARARGDRALDIGVFDEAHKTAGAVGKPFAHALEDANIQINKRLFFTATERVLAKLGKDKEEDDEFLSMDNPEIYGPRAYEISFRQAAERGIILPYEIIVSVVLDQGIAGKDLGKSAVRSQQGQSLNARDIANMAAVRRVMQTKKLSKAITFHKDVASARRFAELRHTVKGARLDAIDGYNRLHVNGSMPHGERREQMLSYAQGSTKAIITNARCLTEGVNVPATDLVGFMDNKSSTVDIVQAVGRTLRRSPGKEKGYVLLPLHVQQGEGESDQEALERSLGDFRRVREVLTALGESDSVLKEELQRVLSQVQVIGGSSGQYDSALGGLPLSFMLSDTRGEPVMAERLARAIEMRTLKEMVQGWEIGYGYLVQFKEEHGHCRVARDYRNGLGFWVHNQLKAYKKGKLSKDRIARLEALGIVWDVLAAQWDKGLFHTAEFVAENGHCNVPLRHRAKDGYPVGEWVGHQRSDYRKGKLSKDRIARLEALGFMWDPYAAQWDEKYGLLVQFYSEHGHCNVPYDNRQNDDGLWTWVVHQRRAYKKGELSEDRIASLEALGFVWDPYAAQWDEGLSRVAEFVAEKGHCNVSQYHRAKDGYPVGQWVKAQRQAYNKGKLSKERIARLEALGIVWTINKRKE